jgi:hypothetical protein
MKGQAVTTPARRTAAEIWEHLVQEAGEDEIEAASSMSVEQAEAYLRAEGFDVAEERAKGERFLAQLGGRAMPEVAQAPVEPAKSPVEPVKIKVRPSGTKRSIPAVWIAAATMAAGGAVATYVATQGGGVAGIGGSTTGSTGPVGTSARSPDQVAAEDLRGRAATALDGGRPEECLRLLDEAKARDPQGDGAPSVVRMRREAKAMLENQADDGGWRKK